MLRKPLPTGVVMGAFNATPVFLIDSTVASGMGVPWVSITSTPASTTSQFIWAPVASIHLRAAWAISGPIPSPVTSVTSVIVLFSQEINKGGMLLVNGENVND